MIEKYLIPALSIVILVIVVELIREEKLTFKYAFGWMLISILAIIFSVFDSLFVKLAHSLGFNLTSDFVLFLFLGIFVFLSLLMTLFLCQQNNHNDRIAQKIGILEFEIRQLKDKMNSKEKKS